MTNNSTPGAPRTKPAEVRLDELMDAAQKLFIEKGFEATTVSDIVREAKVAKGTFYHYFNAKPEILSALRQRFSRHFVEQVQLAMDACDSDDWPTRLDVWCRASVNAYLAGIELHDLLFHDNYYHGHGNSERDRVLAQIIELLRSGKRHGAWQLERPELSAIILYHGMHGAVDNAMHNGIKDRQAMAKQLGEDLSLEFRRLLGC
ncbi:TetR/AcrR family transcriptional regulator [Shewanella algae]|uniref:TetR/AcrR family transcriptional regulator n=1 Tax=Shewanella algae TaxID=38313 RepID=UPI001654C551|nr:TetR/AcrR family transcriptional regulator [Shewanella algae]MBC8797800.1 TetR/AcrR family transcriptional regulator [Shewanella algae]